MTWALCLFSVIISILLSACGKIHSRKVQQISDKYTDQDGYIDPDPGETTKEFRFKFTGSPRTERLQGYNIPVYPGAEAELNGTQHDLYQSGFGVRRMTVAIFTVDVYLGASYVTSPNRNLSADPMAGIAASPIEVVSMTLVRDVTGEQITDSFKKGLAANRVDYSGPEYQSIFEQLKQGGKAGEQVILLSYPRETNQVVRAITPSTNGGSEGVNLGNNVWSNWFGVPADSGLVVLKAAFTAH